MLRPSPPRRPSSTPFSAAALVALAVALAGCGGVGSGSGSEGGDDAGDVRADRATGTLRTSGFGLGDEIATTRVDRFKQAYPDVKLTVNEGAFDAQQFLSAVASGNPPDVIYMDREILGTYAGRGALQDLESCIDSAGIAMDDFREPAVNQVTIDDTVYGVPEFYSVRVVMLDRNLVEDAGLSPDDLSTSDWEALTAAAEELTVNQGSKPQTIGFDPKLPEFLPLWAKANGVDLVSEDGRTANLDDPKVVEALEYAVALTEVAGDYSTVKAYKDGWDFFGEKNEFATDQLAAMPMEDWYLGVLADASPDGALPIVARPFESREGEPITFATGNAWAIPKGAKNADAACAFIASVTEKEAWVEAAKAAAAAGGYTGTYTGNEAADEVIFGEVYKPEGDPSIDEAVQTVLGVQDAAFATPGSPAASEVKDAWMKAASDAVAGKAEPAEALAEAQQTAQAALDKAWQ
jgi:multiple sugar transport system substrate-binding protein